jgi:hypothetical protein
MSILIRSGFQVGDGRQILLIQGGPEVSKIILMIRLVGLADLGRTARREVMLVRRLRVVFKWFMVRNVVTDSGGGIIARET